MSCWPIAQLGSLPAQTEYQLELRGEDRPLSPVRGPLVEVRTGICFSYVCGIRATAFALVVGEVEVVILVRISSEGGVVLARCQGQRSPAFPPSNQPSAKENGIYSQSTGRAKNEVVELGD